MLLRINDFSGIDERKLMDIYAESNTDNIEYFFPDEPDKQLALKKVEDGFIDFIKTEFFAKEGNAYYVLEDDGIWVSALRLNLIENGLYYLEALETRPDCRQSGYAVKLYRGVFNELRKTGSFRILSSVHKENTPSIKAHIKSGFIILPGKALDLLTGESFENEYGFEYRYDPELERLTEVRLEPMIRELFHELWMGFEYDPDLFMDMELYEKCRSYRYDAEKVDAHFDKRTAAADSLTFAVMLGVYVIGEVVLKHIDREEKHCELGIHLISDAFKNKGYGTKAEELAVEYAFGELGMDTVLADCIEKNRRSRHVLEKLGFEYLYEKEGFLYYRLEKAKWNKNK